MGNDQICMICFDPACRSAHTITETELQRYVDERYRSWFDQVLDYAKLEEDLMDALIYADYQPTEEECKDD